jgi:hypothetical protein
MRKSWIWIGLALTFLLVPLGIGYLASPCDPFARPITLAPYRLQQQRFLNQSAELLETMDVIAAEVWEVARRPEPIGMADAYRRAGLISDLAVRLEQLTVPQAPATYAMLQQRMEETRDTYLLGCEELLTYLGNDDRTRLQAAREILTLADEVHQELEQAVTGMQYPPCREVWKNDDPTERLTLRD